MEDSVCTHTKDLKLKMPKTFQCMPLEAVRTIDNTELYNLTDNILLLLI